MITSLFQQIEHDPIDMKTECIEAQKEERQMINSTIKEKEILNAHRIKLSLIQNDRESSYNDF